MGDVGVALSGAVAVVGAAEPSISRQSRRMFGQERMNVRLPAVVASYAHCLLIGVKALSLSRKARRERGAVEELEFEARHEGKKTSKSKLWQYQRMR